MFKIRELSPLESLDTRNSWEIKSLTQRGGCENSNSMATTVTPTFMASRFCAKECYSDLVHVEYQI